MVQMINKLKKKIISSGPMPNGRGKFKKPKSGTSARKVLPYKEKKPIIKRGFGGAYAKAAAKKQLKEAAKKRAAEEAAKKAAREAAKEKARIAAKRAATREANKAKKAALAEQKRLAAKRKKAGKAGLVTLAGLGTAGLAGKATYDLAGPKVSSAKQTYGPNIKKQTYEPKGHVVPSKSKSYSIKSGDTLSQIAKRQGTTLKALLAANPSIKDPNKIRIGQKIKMSAPVKGRKSVYQGLSKSRMAGMAMPKKRATGGKVVKKQAGGRMSRVGLSPAEMARAGVMSEARRRKFMQHGGKLKIKKIPEHKPRKKLDKPYRKRSADPVVRQHGGKIKGPVKITKYPEHKPRKNYGKKRIGRSKEPVVRKSGGTLLVASLYD